MVRRNSLSLIRSRHLRLLMMHPRNSCLDPSLAIRPVFEHFRSVVLTSGTISPLEIYPRILNFQAAVTKSLTMSLARESVCPLVCSALACFGMHTGPPSVGIAQATDGVLRGRRSSLGELMACLSVRSFRNAGMLLLHGTTESCCCVCALWCRVCELSPPPLRAGV